MPKLCIFGYKRESGIATPSLKGSGSGLRSIMKLCPWNVMTQSFKYAHAYFFVNAIHETAVTEMLVRDTDDNKSEVIH